MDLIIVNRQFGLNFGGGENYDYNLAQAGAGLGQKITIISTFSDTFKLKMNENIELINIKSPFLRKYIYGIKGGSLFSKILRTSLLEIDLAIFQIASLKVVLKFRRVPWHLTGLPLLGMLGRLLKNKSFVRWPGKPNRFNRILFCNTINNIANGDVFKFLKAQNIKNLYFLDIGIDSKIFYPKNEDNQWDLIWIGRFDPIKNLERILDIVSKQSNVNLCVVGEFNNNIYGQELYAKYKAFKTIEFLGFQPKHKLGDLLRKSKQLILCSKYDNYPNVILEALACGMAVSSTKNIGFYNSKFHYHINWLEKDFALDDIIDSKYLRLKHRIKSWEDIYNDYERIRKDN